MFINESTLYMSGQIIDRSVYRGSTYSVCIPSAAPDEAHHGHPHVPDPASSALILVAAAFAYGRKRLA